MKVSDTVFCHLSIVPVRAEHADEAEIVTQLLFGELATILEVHNQWRKVKSAHDGYEGWIDYKQVQIISKETFNSLLKNNVRQVNLVDTLNTPWGPTNIVKGALLPNNSPSFSIDEYEFEWLNFSSSSKTLDIGVVTMSYLNSPYLWGGRTPFGIDCSGFTQAVLRFFGVEILRDASQQVNQGELVNFEDATIGDLVFFVNSKGNIHHVGILLENNKIIHASGRVRIDKLDIKGIFNEERGDYSHNFHSIRRFLH